MNRYNVCLFSGLLIGVTFLSCQKAGNTGESCPATDNYLFYLFARKVSGITTPEANDTTGVFINVYKSNAGTQLPALKINGHDFPLIDDGIDRCANGSKFNIEIPAIPKAQLSGYLLIGETNSLQLSGERCGTVSETFTFPNEMRLKPLPSGIIHKSQGNLC